MIGVLISIVIGVFLLALSEWLRLKKRFGNEFARKSVHAVPVCVIASWPLFVSYRFIIMAELIFLALVLFAHKRNLFSWLRNVSRKTWGEFFLPVGIILTAELQPPAWVFAVAMLHLGLADSLAAIIGKRYGKKKYFQIFGYRKSLAGTVAFWAVSLAILTVFVLTHSANFGDLGFSVLLLVPVILALLEAVSVWGTDNLVIPLATLLLLTPFM